MCVCAREREGVCERERVCVRERQRKHVPVWGGGSERERGVLWSTNLTGTAETPTTTCSLNGDYTGRHISIEISVQG